MNSLPSASQYLDNTLLTSKADVFTDLNSLEKLKHSDDKDAALRQVAQQFESMFIHIMLKSMRDANAVFEEGSLFSSSETEFYRDMHDQQLSLSLAHSRNSIGIADAMYRQMSSQYNTVIESSKGESLPHIPREVSASPAASAQRKSIAESPADFIQQLMPHLREASKQLGVPSSFLAAQAALETGWGRAVLADEQGNSSFNVFNIKAGPGWEGNAVETSTLEFEQGSLVQQKASFRNYESLAAAVQDYVNFVKNNPRYQGALHNASEGSDYIRELANAGYATDPQYADKILNTHRRVAVELAAFDGQDTVAPGR